jgi:hypothetical protein
MANRHSHKKRRAEVRARMARTCESYQQALEAVRAARAMFEVPAIESVVTFEHFGQTRMLVITERFGMPMVMLMPLPQAAGSKEPKAMRPTMSWLTSRGTN